MCDIFSLLKMALIAGDRGGEKKSSFVRALNAPSHLIIKVV